MNPSTDAHLTIVFAALAAARHLQTAPAFRSTASSKSCGRYGP
jgi:hypothetical protein